MCSGENRKRREGSPLFAAGRASSSLPRWRQIERCNSLKHNIKAENHIHQFPTRAYYKKMRQPNDCSQYMKHPFGRGAYPQQASTTVSNIVCALLPTTNFTSPIQGQAAHFPVKELIVHVYVGQNQEVQQQHTHILRLLLLW